MLGKTVLPINTAVDERPVTAKSLEAANDESPVRVSSSGMSPRLKRNLVSIAFLIVFIGLWQFFAMSLPPITMPTPVRVLTRFGTMWSDPGFINYAWLTLSHVLIAVAISFTLGVTLALLAYFFPVLNLALYSRLTPFLNSFSGIGWAFLALIWFGITGGAVIFAASVALLPIVIINAGAGLRELNAESIEMSVSFSRQSLRRVKMIILPMMFPYMFATLRLVFGVAWQIVIASELLCGSEGLGAIINMARQRYWTDMVFAVALLILIFVVVTDRIVFARIQAHLRRRYEI